MITPFVAGRLGPFQTDVVRALRRAGFDVIKIPEAKLDLSDRRACGRAVARARADVVIDCSGADDDRRWESFEALDEMLVGAENLALAAAKTGAHSIYVSSVRVFGEAADGPRVESDPPAPTSPVGAATVRAERIAARINEQHTILRSTSLYGRDWTGPFEDLIARVRTTDHLLIEPRPICPPTYGPHLASVLVALVRRRCYGIVHRAASGRCNELELARAVARLAGMQCRIEPLPYDRRSGAAARPVCLTSRRKELPAIPHWRIGLRVCALERQALGQEETLS